MPAPRLTRPPTPLIAEATEILALPPMAEVEARSKVVAVGVAVVEPLLFTRAPAPPMPVPLRRRVATVSLTPLRSNTPPELTVSVPPFQTWRSATMAEPAPSVVPMRKVPPELTVTLAKLFDAELTPSSTPALTMALDPALSVLAPKRSVPAPVLVSCLEKVPPVRKMVSEAAACSTSTVALVRSMKSVRLKVSEPVPV